MCDRVGPHWCFLKIKIVKGKIESFPWPICRTGIGHFGRTASWAQHIKSGAYSSPSAAFLFVIQKVAYPLTAVLTKSFRAFW